MKTIRALNRWRKGYPLSQRDQQRIDNLLLNLKIAGFTIVLTVLVVMFIDGCGGFDGQITSEDLKQMP